MGELQEMDREGALRVLGLDESASESERVAAYWRVRAHVETRLEDAADGGRRARRQTELEDLRRAVELLAGGRAPHGSGAQHAGRMVSTPPARWLIAWSVFATALVVALLASLVYLLAGGRVPGGESPAPDAAGASRWDGSTAVPAEPPLPARTESDAQPPAALMVTANLAGAQLAVEALASGEVVAEGPADGTRLALPPGEYRLRVEHPECSDPWTRELSLAAGEFRELLATSCADQGWLVVRSNVSGDRLEIDGEQLGATGPDRHPLAIGEHQVRVTSEGHVPWEGMVSLPAAEELTLRAVLQPDPGGRQAGARNEQKATQAAQAEPPVEGRDPADRPMAPPEWLERATHYLLSRYDFDRSGALDTVEEVEAIPCNDWLAFERSLDASRLGLPLTRLYGFDGTDWVEGAFGIEGGLRHAAYLHMKECGLR